MSKTRYCSKGRPLLNHSICVSLVYRVNKAYCEQESDQSPIEGEVGGRLMFLKGKSKGKTICQPSVPCSSEARGRANVSDGMYS